MSVTANTAEELINTANTSIVGMRSHFTTANMADMSAHTSDAAHNNKHVENKISALEEFAKQNTAANETNIDITNNPSGQTVGGFIASQLIQTGAMAAMGIPAPIAAAVSLASATKGFQDIRQDPSTQHESTEFESFIDQDSDHTVWRGGKSEHDSKNPEQPKVQAFGRKEDIAAAEQVEMDIESVGNNLQNLNIHNLKEHPEYQMALVQKEQLQLQSTNLKSTIENWDANGNNMQTLAQNHYLQYLEVMASNEDTFKAGAISGFEKGPKISPEIVQAINPPSPIA